VISSSRRVRGILTKHQKPGQNQRKKKLTCCVPPGKGKESVRKRKTWKGVYPARGARAACAKRKPKVQDLKTDRTKKARIGGGPPLGKTTVDRTTKRSGGKREKKKKKIRETPKEEWGKSWRRWSEKWHGAGALKGGPLNTTGTVRRGHLNTKRVGGGLGPTGS